MKKLLDSDWLRAVQFKCNASARSVTPVQKVQHQCKLHIVILDFDLEKDNEKFCNPMISCNGNDKNFVRKLSRMRKKASRNMFRHFFRAHFSCLYY